MALTKTSATLSALLLASMITVVGSNQAAQAKAKHRVASHAGRGSYFVPPPPPYAPSILPEQRIGVSSSLNAAEEADAESPKPAPNPYKKYIFTRNADDMPRVVQPNKYVSNWNKT